jgi:hypothetical protein
VRDVFGNTACRHSRGRFTRAQITRSGTNGAKCNGISENTRGGRRETKIKNWKSQRSGTPAALNGNKRRESGIAITAGRMSALNEETPKRVQRRDVGHPRWSHRWKLSSDPATTPSTSHRLKCAGASVELTVSETKNAPISKSATTKEGKSAHLGRRSLQKQAQSSGEVLLHLDRIV